MNRCFECNVPGDALISHHVIPRSRGGTKTVFLCQKCHDIVHGIAARSISISQLTRDGLRKAKARGVKLGNPNPKAALRKAHMVMQDRKQDFAKSALVTIREIQGTGVKTLAKIAECLNDRKIPTARNGKWTATAVRRIICLCGV